MEIRVNGRPIPGIFLVERLANGSLAVPADAWAEARLVPAGEKLGLTDGQAAFALDAIAGVDYRIDRRKLTLDVTVPATAFAETVINVGGGKPLPPTPSPPGAYVNYDVYGTRASSGAYSYGALAEAIAFGNWGSFVAGGALRGDNGGNSGVRTDTYWRRDFPGRMETVVVGDAVGSTSQWSQPVRFGGVRWGRDFNLAPGFITYPMPSLSGSAALPSTVDVLVNNKLTGQSSVPSGPFDLANVPIVTGAGQMQVVVRDLLGRETVLTQRYYIAPQLLAEGLSDFSIEAGAFRNNYGTYSNDYGSAFGAGTYRRGLTDTLTGEVRGELQRDRVAAGGGIATTIGQFAVVGVAAGYAAGDGERGGRYVVGAQRTDPSGGVSVAWSHADRGFRPFGGSVADARTRDEGLASAGIGLGSGLTASATYTRQSKWNGDVSAVASTSLSISLPDNAHLSISASRQIEAPVGTPTGWYGNVSLIVPLDYRRTISASSFRDREGKLVNAVQATQSLPTGPGWGWRVAASDNAAQRFQAGAAYNSNYGQATAELNAGRDDNAVRVGANGSLGWLQGLAFATRRVDYDSFAVVRVGDIEGIPVQISNQVVATTNRDGLALVPRMLPYQLNRLTINPDEVPFDVEIRGVEQSVIPFARAGVLVEFPVKRSRSALVVLEQAGGAPVPVGARVTVSPGNQEFVVTRRGEVYLTDLQDENRIEVRWANGGCALPLPYRPAADGDIPRIGPLTCGATP